MIDGAGGGIAAQQGDSVCLRNGIPISWKQDGYLRKIYITYRDPKADTPALASAEAGVIVMEPTLRWRRWRRPNPSSSTVRRPFNSTGRSGPVFINDGGNLDVGMWETGPMRSRMRPFPHTNSCR